MSVEQRPAVYNRILDWLRAGYPKGIPAQDYIPLLGVLRRRLTDQDIDAIAGELASQVEQADHPVTRDDIRAIIEGQMFQQASSADIIRVSTHLAAGGWPLAGPEGVE